MERLISRASPRKGVWHVALDRIQPREREFYIAALRRGETLTGTPRIKISTIHGVKGGESDHVACITDMAGQTYDNSMVHPDDEHRVWYVAVTRARESVNLVSPRTLRSYEFE